MKETFKVIGMSCGGCASKIEKFVGEVDGVSSVSIDLKQGQVSVEFSAPASIDSIKEAILDCGFDIG